MGDDVAAKAETQAMAAWTLDEILKLLHPFMPFVTEELWAVLGENGPKRESLLCLAAWPEPAKKVDRKSVAELNWVIDLITEIRSLRSEMNVPPASMLPLSDFRRQQGYQGPRESIRELRETHGAAERYCVRRFAAARLGAVRPRRGDHGSGAGECHRPRRRARAPFERRSASWSRRSRRSTRDSPMSNSWRRRRRTWSRRIASGAPKRRPPLKN